MDRWPPAALLLALLVLAPSAAADWPVDAFAPVLQSLHDGADQLAGNTQALAEGTVAVLTGSSGPASAYLQALMDAAGPLGHMGSQLQEEFVAAGDGNATAFLHNVNGDIHGTCAGMRAALEYHRPYFNDNPLYFDLHGSPGSPFAVCATGWRGALQPEEVQGDLQHGLTGQSRSIDANIDLWLGPARADGTRALWIRQVTYPEGIGDVLEFTGSVVELV